PTPSRSSIRRPFGASDTPAPTSVSCCACSCTWTSIPARASATAVAIPPIPPPTTTARSATSLASLRTARVRRSPDAGFGVLALELARRRVLFGQHRLHDLADPQRRHVRADVDFGRRAVPVDHLLHRLQSRRERRVVRDEHLGQTGRRD